MTSFLYRCAAPLRTHPGWAQRRQALADAGRLSRISPLEMFLTGASASLLYHSVGTLTFLGSGTGLWLSAMLVAPTVCVALGLPIVRAARTPGGRTASGAVAGLWLGCGLLVGEFVGSGRYRVDWFPARPQYLLALLFIAAVPAVWWSQTLRLSLGLRGRGWRRAAVVLCALVTTAVLWCGLWWWQLGGQRMALGGADLGLGEVNDTLAHAVPGFAHKYDMDMSVYSLGLALITPLHKTELAGATAVLMWLVPLVLLLLQRAVAGVRMRRTLGAGLAGGLLSWAGLALASYAMYVQRPGTAKERVGPVLVIHIWWAIAAVMAACLLTAALVAAFSRRYGLLRALVAAQVAQLTAYAGVFLLYSADGCLGPLNPVFDTCQWHPANGVHVDDGVITLTLISTVLGSGCAALMGAGAAGLVRRLRGRRRGSLPAAAPVPASTPALVPTSVPSEAPVPPSAPVPAAPVRRRPLLPVIVGVVTVLALGGPAVVLAAAVTTSPAPSPVAFRPRQGAAGADMKEKAPDEGEVAGKPGRGSSAAPSPRLRAWQTWAWMDGGGARHMQQINRAVLALNSQIVKTAAQKRDAEGKVYADDKAFHRLCAVLEKEVDATLEYFPVPAQNLDAAWSDALRQLRGGARNCQTVTIPPKGGPHRTESERGRLFTASLREVKNAMLLVGNAYRSIYQAADYKGK
uniref:Uncharacterized protein n=1 Tax=Streptomyces lividus TaxID=282216 RepID=Q2MF77_STRLV|nr:hypothetical protein [Streptomyces lividus]